MNYMKIKDKNLKTKSGDILISVASDDILIVKLNDGFFDIERPIYASQLEKYETPIRLLKKNPEGNYETFIIKTGEEDD